MNNFEIKKVSEKNISLAKKFACDNRVYYGYSERDPKNDVLIGKLAESTISDHLNEIGIECSQPDYNVYVSNEKSWAADLKTTKFGEIAVKSTKQILPSFLIQDDFPRRQDVILLKPDSLIIYAHPIKLSNNIPESFAIFPAFKLENCVFAQGKTLSPNMNLRATKRAIYLWIVNPKDSIKLLKILYPLFSKEDVLEFLRREIKRINSILFSPSSWEEKLLSEVDKYFAN